MLKRLIIHIGDSKTGSTALQAALRSHSKGVAWAYPGTSLNHNGLALALSRPKLAHRIEPRFRALWHQVAEKNAETVVVSAELFQAVRPADLLRTLALYGPDTLPPISVIAYCRPHLAKLAAMYSERVKFGQFPKSLDHYSARVARTMKLDYAPRFAEWRGYFGSDFQLRPYFTGQDIVEDFFAQALPSERIPQMPSRPNASMTVPQINLMRRIPNLARTFEIPTKLPPEVYRFICLQMRASGVGKNGSRIEFSEPQKKALQIRYLRDAKELDQLFFAASIFEDALFASARGPVQQNLTSSDVRWFDQMALSTLKNWSQSPAKFQHLARKTLGQTLI